MLKLTCSRLPFLVNNAYHSTYLIGLGYITKWITTGLCVHYEMFKVSKIQVKITQPLPNQNITIKRSKHAREIKGLISVLWLKYYIKVRLSFQILSTQIKIWFIVLITSCSKKYWIYTKGSLPAPYHMNMTLVEESCMSMMDRFDRLISDSSWKDQLMFFCAVDLMPTWLVRDCLDSLISPITKIVNKSLSLGGLPNNHESCPL